MPCVFETRLRVNTQIYLEVMEMFGDDDLLCYQGLRRYLGTGPGYGSKTLLPAIGPPLFWSRWRATATTLFTRIHGLPAAPVRIQLIFLWGYIELHANRLAHPTKTSLIKSIKENMTGMNIEVFVKACRAFRSRFRL